jgi:hypothetical protein
VEVVAEVLAAQMGIWNGPSQVECTTPGADRLYVEARRYAVPVTCCSTGMTSSGTDGMR